MVRWHLVFVIFALLLTELAASDELQPEVDKNESSKINVNQAYDANQEFGPIEYTISEEKNLGTDRVIIKPRSNIETYLSLGVLAFGLVLIIFTGFVASKKNSGWDQEATRIFAVSVVVTAGLFLITAGYSDQQIAPMFGLLGTIVGYLLGKSPGEQGPRSGA
jgi:hypothetical protein